ncbi:MAG: hypothetical protein HYV27_20700 [Candidatus Hydrogenedentes bacterium]|nr:hypothetical protein [Candidatus Hydrogenedentota bacterium]
MMQLTCAILAVFSAAAPTAPPLELPDEEIAAAYEKAATQNVLAAVNPDIFPGYWSVCADGIGHGHGNTFPALDGHQMADALLWLGQVEVVRANWDYVKSFQRPNGQLPFAILPASAGQNIGPPDSLAPVDANGGLYRHWVKADPLRALGYTTYAQNAEVLFRFTRDRDWLAANLASINLAMDYLATLLSPEGMVGGAGYYVERPTRVEYDGVTQGHAMEAFRSVARLNAILGDDGEAARFEALADRVEAVFRMQFWQGDRFAEYVHPERGAIAAHGFTDTDWAAIATGIASDAQRNALWPRLKDEVLFRYGGMPTGIATHPGAYESWEFAYDDRMDLAAMGRVWYLECRARARMGDAEGLADAVRRVCAAGRESGYYWRERYGAQGGFGVEKYCEYPANLIRIVQRFMLGVEYEFDGALSMTPCVPEAWWQAGFGQTLAWRGRTLHYRYLGALLTGAYAGPETQELKLKFRDTIPGNAVQATVNGAVAATRVEEGNIVLTLPAAPAGAPVSFTCSVAGAP